MKREIFLQKLKDKIETMSFRYSEDGFESRLHIDDYPPIFFDNSAGLSATKNCYRWLKVKHTDGSVHEPATMAALLCIKDNFSQRVKTVFDIGALYGYFSLIAKSIFLDSMVYSFEMNQLSYSALRRNVNVNKHLGIPASRCVNIGLSDHTVFAEKVTIQAFNLIENIDSEDAIELDIFSLDDFCRINNIKPDLIKIDVEGYQAKIIPGGMSVIQQSKPIILLEFDEVEQIKKFNTTNREVTKPLFDLGYKCYWIKDQRGFTGKFEYLDYDTFLSKHEVNSLAIFLPS